MSVKREDNICTITFEDENWKEEADRLRKISTMMATLKQAADLAGLEVVGRVVFRDKSTGKEYR